MSKLVDRIIRHPLRSMALLVVIAALLGALRVMRGSVVAEIDNFETWPGSEISRHPEQTGITGLVAVEFRSKDGRRLAGWWVPPRRRAAVILAHGTHADRSSLLPETRLLADAGFGVLAFDWPGFGLSENDGPVRWDARERMALTAAIDWLAARDDVDATSIGAFGLSMGAYILAQVASDDTRLNAVVLAAAPAEMVAQTEYEHSRWGFLTEEPAVIALRLSGMPLAEMVPRDVVSRIGPRPLLIIGGSEDPVVAASMLRELFAAARQPKELWIVPGAGHGFYFQTAPDEYRHKLVDFFSRSLEPSVPTH